MTDIGDGEIKQIVCGGSNLYEGIKVAVAPPGTKVRWHGEGDLIELKKTKIRGVESFGMICASSEIGLYDLFPFDMVNDESRIVDLKDFDVQAGMPLADALGLNDIILEIDNKSLTNRPDLWGHYGIAREIASLYDLPLKGISVIEEIKGEPMRSSDGVTMSADKSSNFSINIDDTERCHRYVGMEIDGLTVKPAPFDIQSRLWCVGLRPINAIVDITNYVMLATGQPTHAFDADIISGDITVRRAKDKEKLLLLNGKELSLTAEDLVIADDKEAVALAGVMGGEKNSIFDTTTKTILEVANFNALSVRRTSMRHDVRTDSASRFEKGIDVNRVDIALALAVHLFLEVYPDMEIKSYNDNYPQKLERKEIVVSVDWLVARLGQSLPKEYIVNKLGRLGFDVKFTEDAKNEEMHITVPSWRSTGDVSIPADIVEEIARMYGYENFQSSPIVTSFENSINQPKIDLDRKIREYFAYRCGMNEVYTYAWSSDEYLDALYPELDKSSLLELSDPPSPNERNLRPSLLPNLCKAASDNLRYFSEFAIFESAEVFSNKEFATPYDKNETLPQQKKHVAGAFVGNPDEIKELYRKAKGVLEQLPRTVHSEDLRFEQLDKPIWADDTIWLNIVTCGNVKIGEFALLSRKAALACGIKSASVVLFEMDIDALEPLPSRSNSFEHISEYPTAEQDFSMLFDLGVKWEDIYNTVSGKKGPDNLVQDVLFVEEYKGQQVPDDKKSITIKLVIGSTGKTLTSDEIDKCTNAVAKRLEKRLGAVLR